MPVGDVRLDFRVVDGARYPLCVGEDYLVVCWRTLLQGGPPLTPVVVAQTVLGLGSPHRASVRASCFVQVTATASGTYITVSTSMPLTFTSGSWDTAQTITITGEDDALQTAEYYTGSISHTASSADALFDGDAVVFFPSTEVLNVKPVSMPVAFETEHVRRRTTHG